MAIILPGLLRIVEYVNSVTLFDIELKVSEISSYNCPNVSYISPKNVDEMVVLNFEYELRNG